MLGLSSGQIQLSPYASGWPIPFLEERDRLRASLGEYVLDIQHIGSTSIPGMSAKPILDIGIAVTNFEEAVRCIPLMEKLGYTYKGENGIPRRHYFVKKAVPTSRSHISWGRLGGMFNLFLSASDLTQKQHRFIYQ